MRTPIRRGPVALLAATACALTGCTGQDDQASRLREPTGGTSTVAGSAAPDSTTSSARPSAGPDQVPGAGPGPRQRSLPPADARPGPPVKRVRTAADCRGLLKPADVSRATGMRAAAAPPAGPGDCSFNLTGSGDGFVQVVLTEDRAEITGRIRPVQVAGARAREQDESDGPQRSCKYRVRMNGDRQLNTMMLSVLYFSSGKDACAAAGGLAGAAFNRLPGG